MNNQLPPKGTPRHQINEPDLAELERILPQWAERLMVPGAPNADRVQIRRVQEILMNVRWQYMPWGEITEIPAGGDEPSDENDPM